MFTGELCTGWYWPALVGLAGAGGMAPPASTRIFARLKRVQGHSSPVNECDYVDVNMVPGRYLVGGA